MYYFGSLRAELYLVNPLPVVQLDCWSTFTYGLGWNPVKLHQPCVFITPSCLHLTVHARECVGTHNGPPALRWPAVASARGPHGPLCRCRPLHHNFCPRAAAGSSAP